MIGEHNPWAAFWRGFGQVLDIGGTMGPTLPDWMDYPDPDAEAIRRDWQAVGDVMREAIEQEVIETEGDDEVSDDNSDDQADSR